LPLILRLFHLDLVIVNRYKLVMRILLTHEQADFDAIGSLLGAYLLNHAAIPVLPNRMNRNVRAFITLYGMDLPFVERRDLPSGSIDAVTLVDTQSMVSIRGMSGRTNVNVIDHHPARGDLPKGWSITIEETGANTTLFVEALQEQGNPLGAVQATLLLMGIYEDTGSLTYVRTTPRDVRAAAYVLEAGASLRIAADFLNHPLTTRQQKLYEQLKAAMKACQVHGHTVIVSCGDAQEMDEELSTVAHKLRDLLDPDALILLVQTRSGVQLIARSTSDHIDVSNIAAQFGGGGHARAAAGLIRDRKLEDIYAELVAALPQYVKPAVTVSQIMSSGLKYVSPSTTAEEAMRRMQRYGYEGYPVVKKGRIIGLLTRRAVDRALAHKLDKNAASLMEAGEVTIKPDDSIEQLQRLMADTGWGQIPVVQPDSGKIIGIVTRTDLLKTLTEESMYTNRHNLAERLETVLPVGRLELIKTIAQAAYEEHCALYVVGGFVRDLLLERTSQDFDLVVEGDAIALARSLCEKNGGRVASHARFGTAKWAIDRRSLARKIHETGKSIRAKDLPDIIDLVSARTEFYTHPSALPTVETGSIKLDLHRRDFTINTLAVRLDGYHYGELYDYWGGLADLRHGLVRCLHSLSFVDDPTRMLRAVRFEQRFGFHIETRTLQLMQEAYTLMDRVSGDRIRHELDHILDEESVSQILARLAELKLLAAIQPDLVWDDWLQRRFNELCKPDQGIEWDIGITWLTVGRSHIPIKRVLAYILWTMRLPPIRLDMVLARLKIPRSLAELIVQASNLFKGIDTLVKGSPSQIAERLDSTPMLVLASLYLAVEDPRYQDILKRYATQWRLIMPTITGHDLITRGVPRGPVYKDILRAIRSAWLDGKINTPDEEARFLDELIANYKVR
jgi:tRNA nucleotidyltransferase (CCA-adding enzyme)